MTPTMSNVMVEGRTGFDWWRAIRLAGQIALAAWFAYWSWQTIRFYFESFLYHLDMLGFDARTYLHAAQNWLAGGDPWTAYAPSIHGRQAPRTFATTSPVHRRPWWHSSRSPGYLTARLARADAPLVPRRTAHDVGRSQAVNAPPCRTG